MSVFIRKVLPEEVAELKVISEETFRETFAHDNRVTFSFSLMVKRQVF